MNPNCKYVILDVRFRPEKEPLDSNILFVVGEFSPNPVDDFEHLPPYSDLMKDDYTPDGKTLSKIKRLHIYDPVYDTLSDLSRPCDKISKLIDACLVVDLSHIYNVLNHSTPKISADSSAMVAENISPVFSYAYTKSCHGFSDVTTSILSSHWLELTKLMKDCHVICPVYCLQSYTYKCAAGFKRIDVFNTAIAEEISKYDLINKKGHTYNEITFRVAGSERAPINRTKSVSIFDGWFSEVFEDFTSEVYLEKLSLYCSSAQQHLKVLVPISIDQMINSQPIYVLYYHLMQYISKHHRDRFVNNAPQDTLYELPFEFGSPGTFNIAPFLNPLNPKQLIDISIYVYHIGANQKYRSWIHENHMKAEITLNENVHYAVHHALPQGHEPSFLEEMLTKIIYEDTSLTMLSSEVLTTVYHMHKLFRNNLGFFVGHTTKSYLREIRNLFKMSEFFFKKQSSGVDPTPPTQVFNSIFDLPTPYESDGKKK